MSIGFLAILALNLIIGLAVVIIFIRLGRAPKDDPRLSRGLQLLQSKIAVLEDLSDRTELQVSQLTGILQQKVLDVQKATQEAQLQIERVGASIDKSKEVARMFQDKIPHQEIIERQNSAKYVRAARLAHEGKSIEEISAALDIPAAEVELLTKFTRGRIDFLEESTDDLNHPSIESSINSTIEPELTTQPMPKPLVQAPMEAAPSQVTNSPANSPVQPVQFRRLNF